MSSPDEYGNGTHTARDPQGPPNVYHPQTEPPPPYEEYADPAVAHGWQNAYDETAELPRIPSRRSRSRSRRKPTPWRSRRVALAAGAVGAVSTAALIAGFAFSGGGSAPGDAEGKHGRTGPSAADGSTEPDENGTATGSDGTGAPDAGTSSSGTAASGSPSPSSDEKESGEPEGQPSSGTSTTPAPTATASESAPGNSDGRSGRGQGSTKKPR
ncbi:MULTISPECIES: hypothetical protein [unclassified Streptomyces]|uniref:hypothetical protein n=1 Tax=unclassified Streptomyces TaxID=2593676 RepID=UPI00224FF02B|nr:MULTISPECIES: hypothetical protein [unclassified Streptomyces]MCX5331682.1 hypothetical protein [Streptomyces sp. NBC_00140]MCX5361077.1 hypothetical protein [Streptomyces sp. NBC_00124]